MRTAIFSLALGSVLFAAQGVYHPVFADTDAERQFSEYQQAIEAAKECRQIGFSNAEYERMGEIINEKIGHDVGAKRLSLLLAAQKDARKLVASKGCADSEVQKLLNLYDKDLK